MSDIVFQSATVISSFYVYKRILNIKTRPLENIIFVLFSCILAVGMHITKDIDSYIKYGLLFIAMILSTRLFFKERIDVAISGMMLSLGLSYGVSLLSLTFTYMLVSLFFLNLEDFYKIIFSAIVQPALVFALFRFPRLKSGFPFLKAKWWAGSVGMIIGGAMIFAIVFTRGKSPNTTTLKSSILIASTGLIMLILWGLLNLTRLYRETQFERCMAEDAEIIAQLRESNEALSKINHSDNKVLPAMYMSVNRFLMEAGAELSPELRAKCDEIRGDLAGLMSYRESFMPHIASIGVSFPSTGVHTIDAVLDYMHRRALAKHIRFDVEVTAGMQTGDVSAHAGKLELLLSELLDNAIIAVSESDLKRICVQVTMESGCPKVSISDSGVQFRDETLGKLGKERASTRLDKGGSGIGFMTIFEAVRELKASLIITRHEAWETDFTKTITILFDGADRFLIEGKTEPQESLLSR